MIFFASYHRTAAVRYAHRWAFSYHPDFYNYDEIGGDCTNFVSQCIFAGTGIMNFTPTFGWYYIDANQKAPAWTGVPYLYQFLTRDINTPGPIGRSVELEDLEPGDLVQLSFDGTVFQHTPIVVAVSAPITPQTVFVAAHSSAADNRPLAAYPYRQLRCIHITGAFRSI